MSEFRQTMRCRSGHTCVLVHDCESELDCYAAIHQWMNDGWCTEDEADSFAQQVECLCRSVQRARKVLELFEAYT